METINVKFRGDGGSEYTGKDRRTKEKGRGTAEDRVEKEITDRLKDAIFLTLSNKNNPPTEITYKKAPTDRPADSDEFREDVVYTARDQAAIKLADQAVVIQQIESPT